jgi:glycosyltransferase involved in cell wall biosynthesis
MKPELAIVNIDQLGYHTDTYNYCKYLKEDFNITYISFHQGFDNINIDGIKTIYVPHLKGFWNLLRGYYRLSIVLKKCNPDIVFMFYARFISIIKIFGPSCPYIFDVRTGSVKENSVLRNIWNFLLWFESLRFKNITVISEGLRKNLHLPKNKCHWLPLGGNRIQTTKDYSNISLLYLGTLDRRNISETVEGLAIFKTKYPNHYLKYDIVGYGKVETEEKLKAIISKYRLEHEVIFHGRVPYDKIEYYLEKSNIGIVYVPVTPFYNHQPSTKLFEFLLAGLPVMATKTSENRLIVNDNNGILIDNSPEGFSKGLEQLFNEIHLFNADKIRDSVHEYTWESIVKQYLSPLLFKITDKVG